MSTGWPEAGRWQTVRGVSSEGEARTGPGECGEQSITSLNHVGPPHPSRASRAVLLAGPSQTESSERPRDCL